MTVVTLDLWHTLIYLTPEDEDAYMARQIAIGQEVLARAPIQPGAAALSDTELGRAFERAYAAAVHAASEGRTMTPMEQFSRAAAETGRDANPRDYLMLLKVEVDRTPFLLAPDALECLKELRDSGYRVGLISNTVGEPGAFLRPILSRLGFDAYIEAYIFSDELPWTKPSPEIFRHALDRLGGSPAEAVHVGDGWADLEGAGRAGYRGSVLFTGLGSYGAKYRKLFTPGAVDDSGAGARTDRLAEVAALVRKLRSASNPA